MLSQVVSWCAREQGCACLQSPLQTPSDLAMLCQVAPLETLPTVIPQGQCVGSAFPGWTGCLPGYLNSP